MTLSPNLIDGILIAAFTALLGIIIGLFKRVRTMETTIAQLDTKVGPLWAQVQSKVAQELHHDDPKYAEMDKLLEQLINLTLTPENRSRLKTLLIARTTDPHVSDEEQKSAQLMLLTMDKVVTESQQDG